MGVEGQFSGFSVKERGRREVRAHRQGHSTSCQWPTRRLPPAARLSNSLLGHGGQCHTRSASRSRQQNLLIRLQEDSGTRGAVQSLETAFQLQSFEAHKPISSDITLGSKKSPDFLAGLTTFLTSQKVSWKVWER